MTANDRVICSSEALKNGGTGARFSIELDGEILPAFVIRYQNRVYAFINQCAHQGVELDWKEGHFFDGDGHFLICATHGAHYHPDSGACAGGPCVGDGLMALAVVEQDGKIQLVDDGARLVERAI